jgi:hypothetical protein
MHYYFFTQRVIKRQMAKVEDEDEDDGSDIENEE